MNWFEQEKSGEKDIFLKTYKTSQSWAHNPSMSQLTVILLFHSSIPLFGSAFPFFVCVFQIIFLFCYKWLSPCDSERKFYWYWFNIFGYLCQIFYWYDNMDFLWSSESTASTIQILQDLNILMKYRDTSFLNLMYTFSFVKSFSLSFGCACLVCSSHIIKNIWDVLVIYSQDTQCMYVWNSDVWKFVGFVLNLKILTQYYFVSLHQNQVEQTSETIYKRKYVK